VPGCTLNVCEEPAPAPASENVPPGLPKSVRLFAGVVPVTSAANGKLCPAVLGEVCLTIVTDAGR
jgi:hypothetical protein